MKRLLLLHNTVLLGLLPFFGESQEASISVQADRVLHRVSPYLTGACIEDVNHEVYGGIDSQMIFGESFAEPVPQPQLKGFTAFGGRWTPTSDGSIEVAGADGPKLVSDGPLFSEGNASVELWFPDNRSGNGGLILNVTQAGKGHDQFNGYEVALEPAGTLVLGRHRQNWEPIRRVPCKVPIQQWVELAVHMSGPSMEVRINGQTITQYQDTEHALGPGAVGLRAWQRDVRFRSLSVRTAAQQHTYPFVFADSHALDDGVSGMWRAIRSGTVAGEFSIVNQGAFSGHQSQRISFSSGAGELGIENQGLNRWGMYFIKGEVYNGYIWARAAKPTTVVVALEGRDNGERYAEKPLKVSSHDWQRLNFKLTPNKTDRAGRFAITLTQPGSVEVGYAFLQPGAWGRFKNLPVRRDVAESLVQQGITVLRQGGSMVNAAEYRWKKMIGPRAQRPPYAGTWYPYASNGWGIFEFLSFCEAAGFQAIPDINLDETPQDMADFIEYANGAANSTWGQKRSQDGRPKPYHLKYLEIGNEEQVDETYWQKFGPLAEAIWAKDPDIILVVGDFAYGRPIQDPFNFNGAASRITTLAAHQKILQLARQHNREVWFDIHTDTEGPRPGFGGAFSYIDALDKIADGAKHRVVIFEFNANNHSHRRALANAAAINAIERDGRLPISTSANCLQPDGQNDNGWNQGLLFLNPSQVWLQPPGYVTRMVSSNYQPLLVQTETQGQASTLDVSAKRSENGKTLVLQVVNPTDQPLATALHLSGFVPLQPTARVETLAGDLDARNTADAPERIKTVVTEWPHAIKNGQAPYTFPARSFTVLKFQ
jgi:hypothetical protein